MFTLNFSKRVAKGLQYRQGWYKPMIKFAISLLFASCPFFDVWPLVKLLFSKRPWFLITFITCCQLCCISVINYIGSAMLRLWWLSSLRVKHHATRANICACIDHGLLWNCFAACAVRRRIALCWESRLFEWPRPTKCQSFLG